jgi:hypothetical protein
MTNDAQAAREMEAVPLGRPQDFVARVALAEAPDSHGPQNHEGRRKGALRSQH